MMGLFKYVAWVQRNQAKRDADLQILDACKLAKTYIERNGFGSNQCECLDALLVAVTDLESRVK
jgi:hypothetical protein